MMKTPEPGVDASVGIRLVLGQRNTARPDSSDSSSSRLDVLEAVITIFQMLPSHWPPSLVLREGNEHYDRP